MYKMTVAVHPVETAIQIAMLAAIHIPINATIEPTPTTIVSLPGNANELAWPPQEAHQPADSSDHS